LDEEAKIYGNANLSMVFHLIHLAQLSHDTDILIEAKENMKIASIPLGSDNPLFMLAKGLYSMLEIKDDKGPIHYLK